MTWLKFTCNACLLFEGNDWFHSFFIVSNIPFFHLRFLCFCLVVVIFADSFAHVHTSLWGVSDPNSFFRCRAYFCTRLRWHNSTKCPFPSFGTVVSFRTKWFVIFYPIDLAFAHECIIYIIIEYFENDLNEVIPSVFSKGVVKIGTLGVFLFDRYCLKRFFKQIVLPTYTFLLGDMSM